MSSVLILLLFVAVGAPAVIAFLRRDLGWRTTGFYAALTLGLVGWHVGFSVGPMPTAATLARAPGGAPEGSGCEQALETAQRGRIILDRSNPRRLVVARELWDQLPEDIRAALTECASSVRPPELRDEPMEVVNRAS